MSAGKGKQGAGVGEGVNNEQRRRNQTTEYDQQDGEVALDSREQPIKTDSRSVVRNCPCRGRDIVRPAWYVVFLSLHCQFRFTGASKRRPV